MRNYCRTALEKGYLNEDEHAQIADWLPLHPDYKPSWRLCFCADVGNNGRPCLRVWGDGQYWATSYYKLGVGKETATHKTRIDSYRAAIRPSRDAFKAGQIPGYDADHANPGGFDRILREYAETYGLQDPAYDQAKREYLLPLEEAERFRDFHDQRVEWQAIPPEEHQTLTRKRNRG